MRFGNPLTRLACVLMLLGAVAAPQARQTAAPLSAARLRAAIENGLIAAPYGFGVLQPPAQTGVRVIDVRVDAIDGGAARITIDLSQKALTYDPDGDVETLIDAVIASTASQTAGAGSVEYRFLVEGLPLDQFLPRPAALPTAGRNTDGPHRVIVSAGHGVYWNEYYGDWRWQRPRLWGIVEDDVNWDIARYTAAQFAGTAFQPILVRQPDREAPPGPSGRPAWQEASLYYMKAIGAPSAVWDIGVDDYARDINTRPLYANWMDAAAVLSIHNNGGEGTGTETWFDAMNGHEAASERLAHVVNNRIVAAIRREYNPNWPDRGLRSCNGCKGENRLASRPAVIVEIAFMDTRSPDNEALQDERFKQIVARALREALYEWSGIPAPASNQTD
jgi:N-acetylmuramoyl-L-alanine amidase